MIAKRLRHAWPCVCCPLLLAACLCAAADARTADFENYLEGQGFTEFTDPVSGIRFHSSTAYFSRNFVMDYVGAHPSLPRMTPGVYMTSNGYQSGPGVSMGSNIGFSADLPYDVSEVHMDFGYSGTGSVTLTAFDDDGAEVAARSYSVSGNFSEIPIGVQSPVANISAFKITTAPSFAGAVDNITLIPEPGTGIVLGLTACGLLTGRRRRRYLAAFRPPMCLPTISVQS